MTAPTLPAPRTVDDLMPDARLLADWLEDVPSRNRLMRDLRVGAEKADAIRDRLRDERPPDPWANAVPVVAESTPDPGPDRDSGPAADKGMESSTDLSGDPAESPKPVTPVRISATPDPGTTLGSESGNDPRIRHAGAESTGDPIRQELAESPSGGRVSADAIRNPGSESVRRLKRVRWAVRAVLVLGVAASVVGNVLHAWDNPISQAIAAWPPLALLLTVELISRVPVHRRSLAFARMAATAVIAGIAAWVSYWHMVGVAAAYGETGASPYLLPLSVDGLVVVASVCLVELGGRIAGQQDPARTR